MCYGYVYFTPFHILSKRIFSMRLLKVCGEYGWQIFVWENFAIENSFLTFDSDNEITKNLW